MSLSHIHPALTPGAVAVITGGASGIGLATARRLAKGGLKVCLADRDLEALNAAAASLEGAAAVEVFQTDVSSLASVQALAAFVAQRLGPVSVLMNNAGVGGGGDALSNPEAWLKVLGVNLYGVIHGVQVFGPDMAASGQPGLIINTGSKQGITQPPGDTAYNVSKSGVKALTEGLAHTLRNRPNCQVTAHLLIPGFTYTGMTAKRIPSQPPGAWTPDQVVQRLFDGLAAGDFYILCQDNETSLQQDQRRIQWGAGDLVNNRPALSRWHPDYAASFARFMETGED
jgi:NAD(P)-dependent dehydrogenase (short-subunit alcohol dehydrogenase family)